MFKFCLTAMLVASGLLSGACRQDPAVAFANHMQRGDAMVSEGKGHEAILEYRLAVQANPRSGPARIKLGDAYFNDKDGNNAFGEYVRAADLMPEDADAQLKAGRLLLMAGQFEDAKSRADKVLRINPKQIDAQILKGNALAGLKDLDGAIAEVENAISSDPSQSMSYASLGALQFAKGDARQAEAAFKKAIYTNPKSVPARLALANLYWATNRKAEAEKAIADALVLEPKNLLANRALAVLYLGSGRAQDAENPLKIIADDAPGSEGRLALADYYIAAQRLPEAKTVLQQVAQQRDSSAASAKLRLAYLGTLDGDRTGAYRMVDEVLAKEPKRVDALIAKTQLQLADGKLTDALATSRSAVAATPASPQAQFLLGTLLAATGHDDEAMAAQREALRVNPRFAPAATELARLSIVAGKYPEAIQLAQSAIEAVPGYAKANLMLARAQMANGNPNGAEQPLKALSANFPAGAGRAGRSRTPAPHQRRSGRRPVRVRSCAGERSAPSGRARRVDAARRAAEENRTSPRENRRGRRGGSQESGAPGGGGARVRDLGRQRCRRAVVEAGALDRSEQSRRVRRPRAAVRDRTQASGSARLNSKNGRRSGRTTSPRKRRWPFCWSLQHKPDEAKPRYQKVLQLDSHAAVAANNLAQMYADSNENLDEALQLAQTAKAGLPKSPEVDDTLGWVYYRKGLSGLAIAALKQCAAVDPQNASYLYHLGLAYNQNGDKFLARQTLERALKLQPDFSGADEARKLLGTSKS